MMMRMQAPSHNAPHGGAPYSDRSYARALLERYFATPRLHAPPPPPPELYAPQPSTGLTDAMAQAALAAVPQSPLALSFSAGSKRAAKTAQLLESIAAGLLCFDYVLDASHVSIPAGVTASDWKSLFVANKYAPHGNSFRGYCVKHAPELYLYTPRLAAAAAAAAAGGGLAIAAAAGAAAGAAGADNESDDDEAGGGAAGDMLQRLYVGYYAAANHGRMLPPASIHQLLYFKRLILNSVLDDIPALLLDSSLQRVADAAGLTADDDELTPAEFRRKYAQAARVLHLGVTLSTDKPPVVAKALALLPRVFCLPADARVARAIVGSPPLSGVVRHTIRHTAWTPAELTALTRAVLGYDAVGFKKLSDLRAARAALPDDGARALWNRSVCACVYGMLRRVPRVDADALEIYFD